MSQRNARIQNLAGEIIELVFIESEDGSAESVARPTESDSRRVTKFV